MSDNVERAISYFEEGFNCAQSVVAAFGPGLGLDKETALKVAGAFGGGMAGMGETCGTVTGAMMVIGLKHPATKADDKEAKRKCYKLTREFVKKFKERNHSTICKELLNLTIKDGEKPKTRCPKFVKDASEIIEEILNRFG